MRSTRRSWTMVGLPLLLLACGTRMQGARDTGYEAVGPDDLARLVMGELLPTGARITESRAGSGLPTASSGLGPSSLLRGRSRGDERPESRWPYAACLDLGVQPSKRCGGRPIGGRLQRVRVRLRRHRRRSVEATNPERGECIHRHRLESEWSGILRDGGFGRQRSRLRKRRRCVGTLQGSPSITPRATDFRCDRRLPD